jgi:hypothetical protein
MKVSLRFPRYSIVVCTNRLPQFLDIETNGTCRCHDLFYSSTTSSHRAGQLENIKLVSTCSMSDRVVAPFDLYQAIIVGSVSSGDAVALLLGHKIYVSAG